jgi:hypothetical protein
MHPSRKIFHKRQGLGAEVHIQRDVAPSINLIALAPPLRMLVQEQKTLQKKIAEINDRLRFGYSDALHDYQLELIKENAHLSCKINELL